MFDPKNLRKYSDFLALGSEIAAAMVVPLLIGVYLDKHFNIGPWGTIIGAFIGFVGAFNVIYQVIVRSNQKGSKNSKDEER